MATKTSHPPTTQHTAAQRLPAPALFAQHPSRPPSPNSPTLTKSSAPTSPSHARHSSATFSHTDTASRRGSLAAAAAAPPTKSQLDSLLLSSSAALDEVSASAAQRARLPELGTRLFGPAHASALRDLSRAQIKLAEAWGPTGRPWDEAGREKAAGPDEALERRVRDERYFETVREGMRDVVARLGEVGRAMRAVEGAGREIWEDE